MWMRLRGSAALRFCFNKKTARAVILALLVVPALGQQGPPTKVTSVPQAPDEAPASGPTVGADSGSIIVPAGTRLALVLARPVESKTTHDGDPIYAQTTAPILAENRVAIPAGTFLQGPIEKLSRRGDRGEFQVHSISLVFANGYVAKSGPATITSEEGTAWRDATAGTKAGAIIAPFAGVGLGALIGSAAHTTHSMPFGGSTITTSTPTGLAIGSVIGGAAGGIAAIVLLARSRHFYIDAGAAMQMTLTEPLQLSGKQVAEALRAGQAQPRAVMPVAQRTPPVSPPTPLPTDHGTCYTPETPGTPPTIIPGTPPIGGSPGTPDIIIPGTPSIPGTPYPCP